MNRKAFTLMELLGVIIILALLMAVIFPNIINNIKNSSVEENNISEKLIYNAVDKYIQQNNNNLKKIEGFSYCITLKELTSTGYISSPIIIDDKDITDLKSVQISYSDEFTYELKNNSECVEDLKNS